jgi:hypothetical protein
VTNCQLYIKQTIDAYGLGFFTVTYDAQSQLTVNSSRAEQMMIESDELALTYLPDYDAEGIYFSLLDKQTQETKTIGFDVRYWQSFQDPDLQSSGVYIFRPKDGQYDSYKYGDLNDIEVFVNQVKS